MSNFTPAWFKKGFFNESLFCDDFLSIHQLLYSNGAFFTPDGRMVDPMPLRCEIFEMMREYVGANLAKKVTNVVDVLKLAAQVEDFPPVTDRIALANGTLYLDGTFQEGKPEIVRNRLTSVERIEAAESTMDGHDVLKAVLRADINNLQATLDEVDQDNFDQAVDMILSAKHIYIIGMRTSTTLADFLGIYLKLLLDDVTVVKEIAAREVYEQMLRIGEGDLIIGISYPRYSKRTISAMKFARDHGARCLGMTDSKVSPLNEISDVCLYAKSEMVSFLDSLVAPMSLINALIMAVGARDRERTFETFRELETVWKEYEVYGTVES